MNTVTLKFMPYIFYGLDDRVAHLHYLRDEGKYGWQGEIQASEKYQKLKEENHPSKMLAIADNCLRAEF